MFSGQCCKCIYTPYRFQIELKSAMFVCLLQLQTLCYGPQAVHDNTEVHALMLMQEQTPLEQAAGLTEVTGNNLLLKREDLQPVSTALQPVWP